MLRKLAVRHAMDPLSFQYLWRHSDQVGALVDESGERVDSALFHSSTVLDSNGALKIVGSTPGKFVCPITGRPVNGFKRVPPLTDVEAFLDFVDWGNDGHVRVVDVARTCAAVMAVDIDDVERFILDYIGVRSSGTVERDDLEDHVHTYGAIHQQNFWVAMQHSQSVAHDHIQARLDRETLGSWLRDCSLTTNKYMHDAIEVDRVELCLALVYELYHAMGSDVDLKTKETATETWLCEADLLSDDRISRDEFIEHHGPALLANLPCHPSALIENEVIKRDKPIKVIIHAPLSGEVVTLWERDQLPDGGGTVSELCRVAATEMTVGSTASHSIAIYLQGTQLDGATRLDSLLGNSASLQLQAVPDTPSSSLLGCIVS